VDDLVTDAADRGKGLGARLMGALKDEARKLGCASSFLIPASTMRLAIASTTDRACSPWRLVQYRDRLMSTLLHLSASPRGAASISRRNAGDLVQELCAAAPMLRVVPRGLFFARTVPGL
jgi:hypothetical protein